MTLQTDHGGELYSKKIAHYFYVQHIMHETSMFYIPQQNGFIEHDDWTIIVLHKHQIDAKSQQHPMTNWYTHTHILVIKEAMESIGKIIIGLTKGCVTHCGLAIYIKKYLHANEEELWKLKYFTMQKYNLQKNSFKRNQNPSRYYNSITDLKFQHKPKLSSFKKSSYKNTRPIIIT
jgi:hypothetical protein